MILKDEAIALRIYPFGNTSQIAVWLSRNHGKLATLAKGSQRARGGLVVQFDLFYTCEVLFYAREHRNLHVLKECVPVQMRESLRRDWRACAAASYAAGCLDRAMPFGPAPPGLYDLLADTLCRLAVHTPGPAFLLRFELLLLQELGLAPDWNRCSKCRVDLRQACARLDESHGALWCDHCAEGRGSLMAPASLGAIRSMLGQDLPSSLPKQAFREARDAIGGLLAHQADFFSQSRDIAMSILSAN